MKKVFFLLLTAYCLLLTGCKPTQLIIHDIQYKDKFIHDSINVTKHDSIRITQKGDTVFYETFRTEFRDKYHLRTDSIYKYVDKSVMVDKLIYKEVERKLTGWQRFFIFIGKWMSALFLLIGIIFLIKYFPDIRKIFIK